LLQQRSLFALRAEVVDVGSLAVGLTLEVDVAHNKWIDCCQHSAARPQENYESTGTWILCWGDETEGKGQRGGGGDWSTKSGNELARCVRRHNSLAVANTLLAAEAILGGV